jgi:hypothetical protein
MAVQQYDEFHVMQLHRPWEKLMWLMKGQMACFCEYGNKSSYFTEEGYFFD